MWPEKYFRLQKNVSMFNLECHNPAEQKHLHKKGLMSFSRFFTTVYKKWRSGTAIFPVNMAQKRLIDYATNHFNKILDLTKNCHCRLCYKKLNLWAQAKYEFEYPQKNRMIWTFRLFRPILKLLLLCKSQEISIWRHYQREKDLFRYLDEPNKANGCREKDIRLGEESI